VNRPLNERVVPSRDQRGIALPMALVALLLLSVLVLGFSALATTEPPIANAQLMASQARALAEAGVEQSVWAFRAKSISSPPGQTAAAPYDGSQLLPVSVGAATIGGFRVTVTNPFPAASGSACRSAAERCIASVGWVPGDGPARPRAHQKVVLVMTNPQALFKDAPAALAARGQLQAAGNTVIDSRADQSCGRKVGTATTGTTALQSAVGVYGAADLNDTPNQVTSAHNGQVPVGAGDVVTSLGTSAFDRYAWTDDDINVLRAYAKAHGTYRMGAVRFDASNRMPNGVVFIDTASGHNITREGVTPATPAADLAVASVGVDAPADPSGQFHGWLFVNGSLSISANFAIHGLIYAQNDLSYHAVGSVGVSGAIITRNIRDVSTTIDAGALGSATIAFNCEDARTGGGTVPSSWTVKTGTYRELCDSCS
jgi:Tfp pilus assembly protein PilV